MRRHDFLYPEDPIVLYGDRLQARPRWRGASPSAATAT